MKPVAKHCVDEVTLHTGAFGPIWPALRLLGRSASCTEPPDERKVLHGDGLTIEQLHARAMRFGGK